MPKQQSSIQGKERIDVNTPRKYAVIFHNDDFTTMEFVILILSEIFFKDIIEATQLMQKVHNEGKAQVGVYSYDIAFSKKAKALALARQEGFPLRITVEPV